MSRREYDAELVPWTYFLKYSWTDLISVQIVYWWEKSVDAHGQNKNQRISSGCWWNIEQEDPVLRSRFRIVRRACINFSFGDTITVEEFNTLVFGSYSPHKVSVIFQEWRGISSNPFRIPIPHSCGDDAALMREAVAPSTRMLDMASDYKQKYLKNADYISVMVRLEKAVERHRIQHFKNTFLDRVLNASNKLQHEHNISNMFPWTLDGSAALH